MSGAWHPDGKGVLYDEHGSTFGDDQEGGEWSVRFRCDDVPAAFIQVTCGVTRNRAGRWAALMRTAYLTGTDPDDLPGTETWSDVVDNKDEFPFDYPTPEEALPDAEERARLYAAYASIFQWDGRPDYAA